MVVGPGEELAGAAGRGHTRASHVNREQVIDTVKAAFVQGQLSKDELEVLVGQALAAQTYADLAVITADIPSGPGPAKLAEPTRPQPRRPGSLPVKSGVCAILAIMVVASAWAAEVGQPRAAVALAVFIVALTAVTTVLVASTIAGVVKLESRHRK